MEPYFEDRGDDIVVILPKPPRALKNRQRIIYVRGKMKIVPSRGAESDASMVRAAIAPLIAKGRVRWPDQSLGMSIEWCVDDGATSIHVWKVGDKPAGRRRTGRARDVPNLNGVICDAMQGFVFTDDNQISQIVARRVDRDGNLL